MQWLVNPTWNALLQSESEIPKRGYSMRGRMQKSAKERKYKYAKERILLGPKWLHAEKIVLSN